MSIASNPVTQDAEIFEYSKAANPQAAGLIPKVPYRRFEAHTHQGGTTRLVPLDLSHDLKCDWPASSPSLLAHFGVIAPNESLKTTPLATSQLFYVLRGQGVTQHDDGEIPWKQGDIFSLPCGSATHKCTSSSDAAFYYVNDEPMMKYLGVTPTQARFQPTLYLAERLQEILQEIVDSGVRNNRVSVLLGNARFPQTRTLTHVIWAMYGNLPVDMVQSAHRHQSVALDLIIDCQPGCYTLIGNELDENGDIINPTRADWSPGGAFVTPPGLWHSHHNESGAEAFLLPIQDAGLHTHLRTLDIHFVKFTDGKAKISRDA